MCWTENHSLEESIMTADVFNKATTNSSPCHTFPFPAPILLNIHRLRRRLPNIEGPVLRLRLLLLMRVHAPRAPRPSPAAHDTTHRPQTAAATYTHRRCRLRCRRAPADGYRCRRGRRVQHHHHCVPPLCAGCDHGRVRLCE